MEHPRTTGSSLKTIAGSCSSRLGSNGGHASQAASLDQLKNQHLQVSNSPQTLGHAMGRYLDQAAQEEPWNPFVKREQKSRFEEAEDNKGQGH